jgi:uncharacterized protein (DUF849 family)
MKYLLDGPELAEALERGADTWAIQQPKHARELRAVAKEIRSRPQTLALPLTTDEDERDYVRDANRKTVLRVNPDCHFDWSNDQEHAVALEVARQLNAYPKLVEGLRRIERGHSGLFVGGWALDLLNEAGEKV